MRDDSTRHDFGDSLTDTWALAVNNEMKCIATAREVEDCNFFSND